MLYLIRRSPAANIRLDEAREQLRAGLWPSVQRREFGRFVDELVGKHQVATNPRLIEAGP